MLTFIFNLLVLLPGETLPASFKYACGSSTFLRLQAAGVQTCSQPPLKPSSRISPATISTPVPVSVPQRLRGPLVFEQGSYREDGAGRSGCVRFWLPGDAPGIPIRLPATWILMRAQHGLVTRQQLRSHVSFIFIQAKIHHIHFIQTAQVGQYVENVKYSKMQAD